MGKWHATAGRRVAMTMEEKRTPDSTIGHSIGVRIHLKTKGVEEGEAPTLGILQKSAETIEKGRLRFLIAKKESASA